MTDQRARELWKAITDEMFLAKRSGMTPRELAVFTDRRAVEILLTALADERRRALGEAAKMICPYCNDPEWITYDPEGDHISPHTGNMFVCRSHKIRAKAHAGQEG